MRQKDSILQQKIYSPRDMWHDEEVVVAHLSSVRDRGWMNDLFQMPLYTHKTYR
jgi:hypothetical protein